MSTPDPNANAPAPAAAPEPEPVTPDPNVQPTPGTTDQNTGQPNNAQPTETLDDILNGVTIAPNEPAPVAPTPVSPTPTPAAPAVAEPNPPGAPQPTYATQADIDAVNRRLDDRDATDMQQQVNADIGKAVDLVKQVAPNLSERAIKGDLYARADEDPRFAKAFEQRGANPAMWNQVLRKVGEELQSESQVITDPQLAANQNALNAANATHTGSAPTAEPGAEAAWDGLGDGAFMNKFYLLAKGE